MDTVGWAGSAVAAGVLAVTTAAGLWWRRREGRVRALAEPSRTELLASLGVVPGTPVTLLQFSSAFCAPCRATRAVLRRVAADLDGVHHLEVDAESHLSAVRALGVWRTPTVLVVDGVGRVIARAIGQPTREQVVATATPLLAHHVSA